MLENLLVLVLPSFVQCVLVAVHLCMLGCHVRMEDNRRTAAQSRVRELQ